MVSFTPILSAEQIGAIEKAQAWLDAGPSRKPFFKIFGAAGTGKTTIAKHLASGFPGKVAYGAFTAKAALNMVKAGCDGATTLHKMLYKSVRKEGRMKNFPNKRGIAANADLLIIDESSMIPIAIAIDLFLLRKPILFLGDPMQLPAPDGGSSPLDIGPDVNLTGIHRQGAGSAILDFAAAIRNGTTWIPTVPGDVTFISTDVELQRAIHSVDQIIAGTNATISALIDQVREDKGFMGLGPQPGERLVSYWNGPNKHILNSEHFEVIKPALPGRKPETCRLELRSLDRVAGNAIVVEALNSTLRTEPDKKQQEWCERNQVAILRFAYAITAHKAQGSQWDSVLVIDQSDSFTVYPHRWLYTAITRASKRLVVFRPR